MCYKIQRKKVKFITITVVHIYRNYQINCALDEERIF